METSKMRQISAGVVFFGALWSVVLVQAMEPGVNHSLPVVVADQGDPSIMMAATSNSESCCGDMYRCGPSCYARCCGCCCGRCGGCCCGCETVGCFNCCCKGSYKFPVPPQYTYFWPGIYSQKTMTGCLSPWRYVPLQSPDLVDGPSALRNQQRLANVPAVIIKRNRTAQVKAAQWEASEKSAK